MADKSYISTITLPGETDSQLYYLKDAEARELISTIEAGSVVWAGVTTTPLTDGASTTPIVVDGKSVPATKGLMAAYTPAGEVQSREFIFNGTIWQELGGLGLLKALAYKDSASGAYTPVGSNADSTVTFSDSAKTSVLKADATFTTTKPGVSINTTGNTVNAITAMPSATVTKVVAGTTKYMKATASGTEVEVATSDKAITALGTPSTETVNKGYTPTKGKLATTSVPNVTNAGSVGTAASWSASVADENLSFSWIANTPTTPATLGTAITVATGGLTTGTDIVTGITSTGTASAVTGYPNATDDTFAKTVSVKTQPTIALATDSSTATGRVAYIDGVSTSGTYSVSFGTPTTESVLKDSVTAELESAPTTTVDSGHTVNAITGNGTAAGQKFTGTQATITVS